jgi:hypothetical protein
MTKAGSTNGRRFQINSEPLQIVPAAHRKAWEELACEVAVDVPAEFRQKWTRAATARVILAEPAESYEELAMELNRSPGAVRYRRQAMIHLLKDEHGAKARASAYRNDPKAHHKHHDYYQVDELLRELGIYEMPVVEQFALARPLRQPSAGWRGDGLSAVTGGRQVSSLRGEFRRLLDGIRSADREVAGASLEEPDAV